MRDRRLLALLLLASCSPETPEPAPAPAPEAATSDAAPRVVVDAPPRPLRGAIDNEALSEVVDGWLESIGNKLRIRDFDGFGEAFSPELRAERIFAVAGGDAEELPLGVRRQVAPAPSEVQDRAAFLRTIEEHVGPWARVSQSRWRLTSAAFQRAPRGVEAAGLVEWARIEVSIHVVGHRVDGGTEVLDGRAVMRVANASGGDWSIERLRMEERRLLSNGRPMFSEVSRAVHVAHDGLRYGEPGNDGDGWNGAAAADVDGDGLFDVLCPGATRGFLYRNAGNGTFVEEAEERGLLGIGGGTGAVFLDVDRDGDQDLALAGVGWRTLADRPAGRSLQLYLNDGRGRFTDATESFGLDDVRLPAHGLTAFDADGDGWTDLFACGYGRMDFETNDSWIEASNGAPDMLLRNVDGKGFEDVTEAAGLEDRRWSYASAAADFDEDGDLDLFVGNNFGTSRLWRNRGDGTFEDVAAELGVDVQGNVMGVLWTDLDGDGRLDLYLSSPTSTSGKRLLEGVEAERGTGSIGRMIQMASGNKLFLSRWSDGAFQGFVEADRGGRRAGWAWSAASPDIDLDGTRDLVCVNGFVTGELTGDT